MKNKRKKQTAQRQLTQRFVILLMSILISVNLIFILVLTKSTYEYMEDQANQIFDSVALNKNATSDWETVVDAYVSKDEDDALKISLNTGDSYYSAEGQEKFRALKKGRQFLFFNNLFIAKDGEVYYFQQRNWPDLTAALALNVESIVEMTSSILFVSILLNLIALGIGGFLIYLSVGRWSKSLSTMAREINQIEENPQQLLKLSVPENPIETSNVATAFNMLLEEQRQAMAREQQFVTDASHELRTPLAAIRGHVQLIQRRGTDHPEVIPNSIAFIDKESKRMEKMTNQLLLLGRNSQENEVEAVNVGEIVQQEIDKIQLISKQTIRAELSDAIILSCVKLDLQRLVQNIIENAVKYSDASSEVFVYLSEEQQKIIISVLDEGIGIPDNQKDKIFERFYRVDDSRSSEIEGSGIGLSLVAAIVDKYHGEIEVLDNKPKGTQIKIILPK